MKKHLEIVLTLDECINSNFYYVSKLFWQAILTKLETTIELTKSSVQPI